jgi:hypothetical protein
MKTHVFGFALLSAIAVIAIAPAQAQNGTLTRSFVSSAGVDTNACTIAAPCASFATAYTRIGSNGIIAALDPGKYGPLTITGPVTVNGNGWAAITGTAGANGITINAVSGNVILTGLEVDGAGAAYNGIVFNTGTSLTVSNCIVKDFIANTMGGLPGASGNGILISPTAGTIDFAIINTIAVNNQTAGISYFQASGSPVVTGAIDHVVTNNSASYGISVELWNGSGGSAAISISNSVASNNGGSGIAMLGPSYTVTVDNDQISNNLYGVHVNESTAIISRSVITNNSAYGLSNASGTIATYLDNRIVGNGHNNSVFGTGPTTVPAQ